MKKQNSFFTILQKRILIYLLVIISVITSFSLPSNGVYASSDYPYDNTNVLEDLESAREFDVKDYPANKGGKPAIVNFVEWCYAEDSEDFALYVYFYNPQQWNISEQDEGNVATMAIAYNANGSPTDYESFKLIFCSKTEDKLLYKFRIEDHDSADRNNIQSRVDPKLRRYDMSTLTFGITNSGAKTIAVGGCFKFSGYAKGYGDSDVSTLKSEGVTYSETLRLVVNPTVFRTAGSELGDHHQVDVNSVYFSVPEKYFTEYGNLQKIKAEWYEYKLKPMMTFEEQSAYDKIEPFLGVNIGEYTEDLDIGIYENYDSHYDAVYGILYNIPSRLSNPYNHLVTARINTLYLGYVSKDGIVPRETVESAVKGYNKTYNKDSLTLGGTTYSLDIFEDSVDEGRTMGYNLKEIDAGDKFNLLNFTNEAEGWWAKLWNLHDYTQRNDVTPIESNIEESILSQSEEKISQELLINKDDVYAFKDFYKKAKNNNERTVLFRFAQTDYYNKRFNTYRNVHSLNPTFGEGAAWVSYQTVFLNFRIITLTFSKNGTYTVIPVAQDPIDIINAITPHPDDEPGFGGDDDDGTPWWYSWHVIVGLVIVIVACIGFLLVAIFLADKINDVNSTGLKVFLYILYGVLMLAFLIGLHYLGSWAIGFMQKYGGFKIFSGD